MMRPTLVRYTLAEPPDVDIWTKAEDASQAIDLDQAVVAIAGQHDLYASLLDVPEAILRAEVTDFDGSTTSRGAFIVNLVLGVRGLPHAAVLVPQSIGEGRS